MHYINSHYTHFRWFGGNKTDSFIEYQRLCCSSTSYYDSCLFLSLFEPLQIRGALRDLVSFV